MKTRLQIIRRWAAYRLGLRDTHGVKKIRIQLSIGDLFLVGVDQQGYEIILESTRFVPGIWPHLVRPYKSEQVRSQLQDLEHDFSMRRHLEVIGMGGKPASLCIYREIAPTAVPFIWEEKP